MISDPPMYTLKEIQDGTYSIEDVMLINEILDFKMSLNPKTKR